MLWFITIRGRPATLSELDKLEGGRRSYSEDERETIICRKTRRDAIRCYIYHFWFIGFTWMRREPSVEVNKFSLELAP